MAKKTQGPRQVRRLTWLFVMLFCPLFLHSCSISKVTTSLGPAAPIIVLDPDPPNRAEHQPFQPIGLAANVCFLLGLVWVLQLAVPRRFVLSNKFLIPLGAFILFSYSLLLADLLPAAGTVWAWTIAIPSLKISEFLRPIVSRLLIASSEVGSQIEDRVDVASLAIGARIYFVLFLAVGALIPWAMRWFRRHVLQTTPDRWWQFTLRGWLILTVFVSIIVGVICKLFLLDG